MRRPFGRCSGNPNVTAKAAVFPILPMMSISQPCWRSEPIGPACTSWIKTERTVGSVLSMLAFILTTGFVSRESFRQSSPVHYSKPFKRLDFVYLAKRLLIAFESLLGNLVTLQDPVGTFLVAKFVWPPGRNCMVWVARLEKSAGACQHTVFCRVVL